MYKYLSGNALDFGSIPNANNHFWRIEITAVEYLKDKIFLQRLFEINLLNKRKRGNKSEQQKEAITNVH